MKFQLYFQVTSKSNGEAWYFQYHDYGCYCVAPSDPKKNRGRPVDAIDRRGLHKFQLPLNSYFVIGRLIRLARKTIPARFLLIKSYLSYQRSLL